MVCCNSGKPLSAELRRPTGVFEVKTRHSLRNLIWVNPESVHTNESLEAILFLYCVEGSTFPKKKNPRKTEGSKEDSIFELTQIRMRRYW